MVAQDVIRTTGRHSKTLLINRSIVVEFGKNISDLVVFQSAGKFSCSGIPPSHFAGPYALNQRWNQKSPLLAPPARASQSRCPLHRKRESRHHGFRFVSLNAMMRSPLSLESKMRISPERNHARFSGRN